MADRNNNEKKKEDDDDYDDCTYYEKFYISSDLENDRVIHLGIIEVITELVGMRTKNRD